MKNYYLILGVDPDATLEQVRSAYRLLVKDLHPDYYGQDSEPFLELQEAYAVLSDPARRRAYDKKFRPTSVPGSSGRVWAEPLIPGPAPAEPLIPSQAPVDLGDLSLSDSFRTIRPSFDELFNRLWRNFSLVRPKVENLRSLTVEIPVSPHEALRGGWVRLKVPAQLRCPACRGHGGIGYVACWHCQGQGIVSGEYPVIIDFPPGIVNNHVVQVPLNRLGIDNFYLNVVFRVSRG